MKPSLSLGAVLVGLVGVGSHSWWSREAQATTATLPTPVVEPGEGNSARLGAMSVSVLPLSTATTALPAGVQARGVPAQQFSEKRASELGPFGAKAQPFAAYPLGAGDDAFTKLSPELPIMHPLAKLDEQDIRARVQHDLLSLGSMSIGAPNRGALMNPVQFPEGPHWQVNHAEWAWGTAETVEFLSYAIERVNQDFADSPKVYIGDLSKEQGGFIKRHKSHQSGRDVDVGYYYLEPAQWYQRATAKNLDRPRSWALIRTLLLDTPIQYIFMDRSLQVFLRAQALKEGEDPAWVRSIFEVSGDKSAIIRHRKGHATHFHVRFDNPVAELSALRAYPWLVEGRLLPKRMAYYPGPRRARARR